MYVRIGIDKVPDKIMSQNRLNERSGFSGSI
jgi:hypothetical protein